MRDLLAPYGLSVALLLAISSCQRHTEPASVGSTTSQPAASTYLGIADPKQFENPLESAGWQESGSWPQFAHDPLHTGRTGVEFPSTDLQLVWQFRPTTHVWEYQPGYSVWSCPVAATVAVRPLVIAGCYDRNVYAVDGETGLKVWEFQPGDCVFASPALAAVDGRPIVFIASINRSIYALDARTGERLWSYETSPWSFTAAASLMASPTVVRDGSETILLAGVWNSDRSASRNVQAGELIALSAANGSLRWRRRLGSVPVNSPAVARFGKQQIIFVTTHDGMLYALDLANGDQKRRTVLNEVTRSSPSIGIADGVAQLFVGTRLHSVFGLDLATGARRWRAAAGYWIDSTPAWFPLTRDAALPRASGPDARRPIASQGFTSGESASVVAGSYDRNVYGWSAGNGRELWKSGTGNFAYSSPAVATQAGKPVAFLMSWDGVLYMLDGLTGAKLWETRSGPLLWSHAFQGDSLWASPVVARLAGNPTLLFPGYDGVLRAYRAGQAAPAGTPPSEPP